MSAAKSFIQTSFDLLKRFNRVSKTDVLSLYALGGFLRYDPGHERGRKLLVINGEGDEIQDGRRNGLVGRRGRGVGVCALQVHTPQVSGRGDGVALWAQLLVPL